MNKKSASNIASVLLIALTLILVTGCRNEPESETPGTSQIIGIEEGYAFVPEFIRLPDTGGQAPWNFAYSNGKLLRGRRYAREDKPLGILPTQTAGFISHPVLF